MRGGVDVGLCFVFVGCKGLHFSWVYYDVSGTSVVLLGVLRKD